MRPRTTIALAGVLALLCVAYWGMEYWQQETKQRVEEAKKLFSFEPPAVQSVTIEREGERPSTGVRTGGTNWKVTEPYEVRPNSEIWERVAKALSELKNERTIAQSPEDLDQYGLAKPVLKVNAKLEGGTTVNLSFGVLDPTKKFRYALHEDGTVFLVTPESFFELDRSLLVLRDRYLFENIENQITHLEFAWIVPADKEGGTASANSPYKETVTIVVELGEDKQWHLVKPATGLADQEMIGNFVSDLQYSLGRGYVDKPESLSDYGLDPPLARVSVRCGKDGALQTVYYGSFDRDSEKGGIYVRKESSPGVFVVDSHIVTLFPKRVDAFNEKRILTRPAADIRSLKYEAGPQTFTLENPEGKAWRLADPPGMETDQAAVSRFIGTLVSAKGTDYYTEIKPEFGLDAPAIRMTVTYADSPNPVQILVGAKVPDVESYYVTQDTGAVTKLDKPQVDAWRATYTDFVSKGLLSFRKAEASQVELTFEGVSYLFRKGERAWLVDEPKGKVWETQSDMEDLLQTLETCIADDVATPVTPPDLAPYGLDAPMMTVRVTAVKESQSQGSGSILLGPLAIGKISETESHQRYAMVAGRPEIFRIRQLVIEQIRDILKGVIDATPVSNEAPPVKVVQ
ncbi:MAG: DUF4340 domain-containing protein [Candidatus Hydrogenedentes bacterium]|nr:DUF4340 domain-containing protein [Candidatus Hydrogenedentota bacterium]